MNNELYHHGIKGMRWGIRRYQNKDGSLTQEGKSRISGDKRVRFGKGLLINRVSYRKTSDATTGKKMYGSLDQEEHDMYKFYMSTPKVINDGKVYVQQYISKNNIRIPSIKEQIKIERSILKDADANKEISDRLSREHYPRADALIRHINVGRELFEASPDIFSGNTSLKKFSKKIDNLKNVQLSIIERSIAAGDVKTNEAFEDRLRRKGFNAYRDTFDRGRNHTKTAIAIIDSNKNAELVRSDKLTREEYVKAVSRLTGDSIEKVSEMYDREKVSEMYDRIIKSHE